MAATPKKIGKYTVISQLAAGGMGEIYKAEHPTLGSTVIIKCLTIKKNPAIEERFRREARIMMDLRDERIVQVYDHFKERSSYCIVMEYVDGIDLDTLIKEKRYLPNELALTIFIEVCRALKYAHERQVIHRDIKPANILISKTGRVKLTDFGVASTMEHDEDLTRTGMSLGTPAYMSPEQISDASRVDQRADIYSIGVLLYVMLTGQKPYESSFEPHVLSRITRGRYILPRKINPKISPAIQRLIKKTMHHRIKKRWKDTDIILSKCSKLFKPRQDQKQTIDDIRRYLEGKELQSGKGLKRKWFGLKHATAAFTLLVLCLGALAAYRNDLHYEFLYPDEYGLLTVEARVRETRKDLSTTYFNCSLFARDKKGWKKVEGTIFDFKKNGASPEKNYTLLRSRRNYLPEGNYLIRLDIENEQYQTQFYLSPRAIQKKLPSQKDGHRIQIAMEKAPPRLPLKLKYAVINIIGGKEITADARMFIFYENKWMPWEEFSNDDRLLISFTSGKDYSFKFSADGFFTKQANISVDPEQTLLNIDVDLIPLPGNLIISSEIPNLTVLMDNLPYYLEGKRDPAYKKLPSLNNSAAKISLPAGEYTLTLQEEKPLWRQLSLFPPKLLPLRTDSRQITIRQGETLKVAAGTTIADGPLKLAIQ